MSLKDQMTTDIALFLNADDFGEEVTLGSDTIIAIMDVVQDTPRSAEEWQGLARADRVLYVDPSDLTTALKPGMATTLNAQACTVIDVMEEGALLRILLRYVDDGQQLDTCTVTHYAAGDGWTAPSTSSTETDIACRVAYDDTLGTAADGRQLIAGARFSFGLNSGLTSLAVGDEIQLTGDTYNTWRVIGIEDSDRDQAGARVQRIAKCVRV